MSTESNHASPDATETAAGLDMADAAPPIRPPPLPRSHPARWIGAALLLSLLALGALISLPFSASGTHWLLVGLQRVVGLEVEASNGALLGGDFSAQRLRYPLTPDQTLVIEQLAWQGLRWERPADGPPLGHVHLRHLSATRVDVQGTAEHDQPLHLPTALSLPLALDIERIEIGELLLDAIRERPVRDLTVQHLGLGAGSAGRHRLDALQLQWDRVTLQGQAELAAAPLVLQAQVRLVPRPAAAGDTAAAGATGVPADWSLALQAQGPLADLALRADLQARGQSLKADARLQLEESIPLSRLQAQLEALDLAPWASGLPHTALSGTIDLQLDTRSAGRAAQPLSARASLRNDAAGALAAGRIPLRAVELTARGDLRAPDQGRVDTLQLTLGTAQEPAGSVDASGRWALIGQGAERRIDIDLEARVSDLRPQRLHPASPALHIGGPLAWHLSQPLPTPDKSPDAAPPAGAAASVPGFETSLRTRLTGRLIGANLPSVTLALDAQAGSTRLQVDTLQADAGGARLSGKGSLVRRNGQLLLDWSSHLQAFDPALWWPRPTPRSDPTALDRLLAAGPHELNGQFGAKLQWPTRAPRTAQGLAQLRGQAQLDLQPSRLAGLALSGEWQLNAIPNAASAQPHVNTRLALQIGPGTAPTTLALQGELDPLGNHDQWQLTWNSASLAQLTPWLRLLDPVQTPELDGRSEGEVQIQGRWPQALGSGRFSVPELRWGSADSRLTVRDLHGHWRVGSAATDPLEIEARLDRADARGWQLNGLTLTASGSLADHRLRVEMAELVQHRTATTGSTAKGNGANNPVGNGNGAMPPLAGRLEASGSAKHDLELSRSDWHGQIEQFELSEKNPPATPPVGAPANASSPSWLTRPVRLVLDRTPLNLSHSPSNTTVTLGATRAHLGDLHLALQQFAWQQDRSGALSTDRLALQGRLDSIDVAPLLRRAQPGFGWGGDLRIGGSIDVQATPERFNLAASVQRDSGDLQVTDPDDPKNPQRLGLVDLRLGLTAREGQWRLTQTISGGNLGRLEGEQGLTAPPSARWPPASTPVNGKIDLQVAQLGNWGRWLPAGWRLSGQLATEARITGQLGAPELSGELVGRNLAVRNLLQGVDWHDAQLRVRLDGSTARVETASVRAGDGQLSARGEIVLGAAPRLDLNVSAERFAALQRVDRRVIASGTARLQLDASSTVLTGTVRADEGRFDFSQSDAPGLADDVEVLRPEDAAARERAAAAARSQRRTVLDLRADLGPAFTLKGRGLATRLAGELRLSSPANKLAINGVIRAEDGNYAAYGQKLKVDRGLITFIGTADNPRLDIEATRPDLEDVRVGVIVTGTAQAPRIRLFSEPSMSDTDRLSWLLLGRASDGLGRTDLALLQRAAYALLAGENDSPSIVERIGLDQLSVRQNDTGDTRETVVSLGKQLSRRWYVGYERSLNAAAGTWQLIYRAAQRFTLRAQSGTENALDLIWTWKWGDTGEKSN